jgi:hypothetical protein
MSDERPQRIGIGFIGGQSTSARVNPAELLKLRQALGTAGWYELKAEDGTIALDLAKVVFVQVVGTDEPRVGFGT